MSDRPNVQPHDWIYVKSVKAVVCNILDKPDSNGGEVEVVYLSDLNKAINEYVKWVDDHWEFAILGPCGGYADGNSRLAPYVGTLRV